MYDWKIQFFYKHEPVNSGLFIIAADDLGKAINLLQDIIHDDNAPPIWDYWSIVF